jgi:hypothetical protein
MAIIGTLPNNIQNGQLADAVPVMADFNFIVNQVNANASPLGTLDAPSGTRMLFNQASVPLGWSQETGAAFGDCSLRVVTGSGGATAGSTAWSAWNSGGTFNVNAFTISVAQMPVHSHTGTTGSSNQSLNHTHSGAETSDQNLIGGSSGAFVRLNNSSTVTQTGATDLTSHGHSFTTNNTGSGSSITPTFTTPAVKYTDMIIGVKA